MSGLYATSSSDPEDDEEEDDEDDEEEDEAGAADAGAADAGATTSMGAPPPLLRSRRVNRWRSLRSCCDNNLLDAERR